MARDCRRNRLIRPTVTLRAPLKASKSAFHYHSPTEVRVTCPLTSRTAGKLSMLHTPATSLLTPLRSGETINQAIHILVNTCRLPGFVRSLIASYLRWTSRPPGRNDVFADLLACIGSASAAQERALIVRRDAYREQWRKALQAQGIDFVLSVPHALPPMPKGGTGIATLVSANYAFLYNIVS